MCLSGIDTSFNKTGKATAEEPWEGPTSTWACGPTKSRTEVQRVWETEPKTTRGDSTLLCREQLPSSPPCSPHLPVQLFPFVPWESLWVRQNISKPRLCRLLS